MNQGTDNKHFKCPPKMDDGRHFTEYRSNCHINNLIRANNTIMNSHEYRMFLTRNGSKLMNLNRSYSSQKNGCGSCANKTMLSEQTMKKCNNVSCSADVINKAGVGQGRQYNDSQQPHVCGATTNTLYNYYNHMDTKAQGELVMRNSKQAVEPQPYNL